MEMYKIYDETWNTSEDYEAFWDSSNCLNEYYVVASLEEVEEKVKEFNRQISAYAISEIEKENEKLNEEISKFDNVISNLKMIDDEHLDILGINISEIKNKVVRNIHQLDVNKNSIYGLENGMYKPSGWKSLITRRFVFEKIEITNLEDVKM